MTCTCRFMVFLSCIHTSSLVDGRMFDTLDADLEGQHLDVRNVLKTRFEHPSVHPQEDLYMQFCGISFTHPYKQPGRWQDVLGTASDRAAYMDV